MRILCIVKIVKQNSNHKFYLLIIDLSKEGKGWWGRIWGKSGFGN